MSFGNYEEEDQIPPLIPLRKKKVDAIPIATPSQKNSKENDELKSIMQSIKGTPTNQQGSKDTDKNLLPIKKPPNPEKIEEIQKKAKQKISTVQRKDNEKKVENERQKQFQKMKFAIAKRLNSMSMKNLSEELYPVSTEAIQQLLAKIERDIAELNSQFERKESTLAVNQNNLHLKKELQTMRRQIDHCCLIKELYHEKLNYRTKIQTLEQDIQNLTNENKDLKKKLARALESIENYKHNLPGQNEKELKQKLSVCMSELQQQKEMRHTLDRNIDNIIVIFKRLYDEADSARQIVTRKLKQLEERERKLRKIKEEDFDNQSKASQPQSPTRRVATLEMHDKDKQQNNSHSDLDHSQTVSRKFADQDIKKSTIVKTKGAPTQFSRQKQESRKTQKSALAAMTLEQKIRKMRNNQNALNKTFEK